MLQIKFSKPTIKMRKIEMAFFTCVCGGTVFSVVRDVR